MVIGEIDPVIQWLNLKDSILESAHRFKANFRVKRAKIKSANQDKYLSYKNLESNLQQHFMDQLLVKTLILREKEIDFGLSSLHQNNSIYDAAALESYNNLLLATAKHAYPRHLESKIRILDLKILTRRILQQKEDFSDLDNLKYLSKECVRTRRKWYNLKKPSYRKKIILREKKLRDSLINHKSSFQRVLLRKKVDSSYEKKQLKIYISRIASQLNLLKNISIVLNQFRAIPELNNQYFNLKQYTDILLEFSSALQEFQNDKAKNILFIDYKTVMKLEKIFAQTLFVRPFSDFVPKFPFGIAFPQLRVGIIGIKTVKLLSILLIRNFEEMNTEIGSIFEQSIQKILELFSLSIRKNLELKCSSTKEQDCTEIDFYVYIKKTGQFLLIEAKGFGIWSNYVTGCRDKERLDKYHVAAQKLHLRKETILEQYKYSSKKRKSCKYIHPMIITLFPEEFTEIDEIPVISINDFPYKLLQLITKFRNLR